MSFTRPYYTNENYGNNKPFFLHVNLASLLSLGLIMTPIISGNLAWSAVKVTGYYSANCLSVWRDLKCVEFKAITIERIFFILAHKLSNSMKIKYFSKNHFTMTFSCYCCCRWKVHLCHLKGLERLECYLNRKGTQEAAHLSNPQWLPSSSQFSYKLVGVWRFNSCIFN